MKYYGFLVFLLVSLFARQGFSQNLPRDYFSSPLDIPLELSGTFGELRSNHFHSGMDIRTQKREGLPVYAPADGHVSRIKVQHFGYGKALYIRHPNGYTTVYAHLREYAGKIQDYVKKTQYDQQKYEVELFPQTGALPIKKGDIIGYSGNTGGSSAPHLHYEIRDGSQRPMNPLSFGYDVGDTRPPVVNSVWVYPTSDEAQVNGKASPVKLRLRRQEDGSVRADEITACGQLGFGVSAYDQQDAAENKNGVYKIESSINGEKLLTVDFQKFSFSETRYINRYIDYGLFKEDKERVQKLFIERGNPLSIFTQSHKGGFVEVEESFHYNYIIRLYDAAGNITTVTVPVKGEVLTIMDRQKTVETPYFVNTNENTSFRAGRFDIYIPKNSLYENTYLNIGTENETLALHRDVVPVHSNITISFDASAYTKADREKLYIGWKNYSGPPQYYRTSISGDKLSIRTRLFGDYTIAMDSIQPVITPLNFSDGKWISNNETLKLKIEDDGSGIKGYRATVNGHFILMEYEYKDNTLTHYFSDGVVTDTENHFRLVITDHVGNSTVYEATFFRK